MPIKLVAHPISGESVPEYAVKEGGEILERAALAAKSVPLVPVPLGPAVQVKKQ